MKNKNKIFKRIFVVGIVCAILGCILYLQDGYSMDSVAKNALNSTSTVIVKEEPSATLFLTKSKNGDRSYFLSRWKGRISSIRTLDARFS